MRVELRDWMLEFLDGPANVSATELAMDVSGVRLRAWVTPDRHLVAEVDVARGFSPSTEKALYEALDQRSSSLIAGLLLWEWRSLRKECEVRGLASGPAQLAAAS